MPNEEQDEAPSVINLPASSFSGGRGMSDSTIKWQETANDILAELEHDLRGEEMDMETGKYVKAYKSLMNDSGIRCIKSIIRTRANKVVFLSKLSEANILNFCQDINIDLVDQIALKHQQWQLKKENCTMVVLKVVHLTFAALMRAEGEGERRFLRESRDVHEIIRSGSDYRPADEPARKKFLFW